MGPDRTCGSGTTPALDPLLLEQFVRPLLAQLRAWSHQAGQEGRRLPVIGLNGPVGAGKSTLGRQLEALAPGFGLRLMVASIDDLYLTWPKRRERLAGNPFGVSRVPPGSHDLSLLLKALASWRAGGALRLPRFDKTLAGGEGDRSGWREQPCDALVLEGWLMGCRPLPAGELDARIAAALAAESQVPKQTAEANTTVTENREAPELNRAEWLWLPRWNRELAAYVPLWQAIDALWVLRPLHWDLPRRWRFQAEARQRRSGGGWLPADQLGQLVRASLCSLPPQLFQDPLVGDLRGGSFCSTGSARAMDVFTSPWVQKPPGPTGGNQTSDPGRDQARGGGGWAGAASPSAGPPVGAVAWLDGRRRCRRTWLQASPSASSSATG